MNILFKLERINILINIVPYKRGWKGYEGEGRQKGEKGEERGERREGEKGEKMSREGEFLWHIIKKCY